MSAGPAPVRRGAGSRRCKLLFSPASAGAWVGRAAGARPAIGSCSGLLIALLLAGCSTPPNGFSLFVGAQPEVAVASADPDACPTPEACAVQLKQLVKEPRRDWIGRPQSAEAYATGTRLFAYRALRKKLSCGELTRALQDTTAAAELLQSPRHEHARALTTAVGHELKAEHTRRCRPKP